MEDADFSFQMTADPLVSRFIGGIRTLDWHRQRIAQIIDHQRIHGFSRWTVVLKSSGEQIGRCGPMLKAIEGVNEMELGYALARAHWGRGYATEAAKAALERYLNLSDQRRIVAIIDPENHASIRVAETTGMVFERMIDWEGEPANLYSLNPPASAPTSR